MSESAHKHLLMVSKRTDTALNLIIRKNGIIHLQNSGAPNIFLFLARTLVGQQLSKGAADTIWRRMQAAAAGLELELCELCQESNMELIRKCGISSSKAKALLLLRRSYLDSIITDEAVMKSSYEDISELVTSLWGFGQWSADMVAIFYAKLPDVFPSKDVAVQRGLRILSRLHCEHSIYDRYSPYRSYLCRHVWAALDSGLLDKIENPKKAVE